MQHVLGIVTIVQEGRFCLSTPDGRSLLFSLSRDGQGAAQDLAALCARMAHVQVAYDKVEGRSILAAHRIREMGARWE